MHDPTEAERCYEPEAMGNVADAVYKLRTQFTVLKENDNILRQQNERLKKAVIDLAFWESLAYTMAVQMANKQYDGLAPNREESVYHHAMAILGKHADKARVLRSVQVFLKGPTK